LGAIAQILFEQDRLDEAIAADRRALEGLPEGSSEQAASLAGLSHRLTFEAKNFEEALDAADAALAIAEPAEDWETVVRAFNTIARVRERSGRVEESIAFRERTLKLSLDRELTQDALRAYNNVADAPLQHDRFREALERVQPGVELAKARGDRTWQEMLSLMVATSHVGLGNWDEALRFGIGDIQIELARMGYLPQVARIQAGRGELDALRNTLELAVGFTDSKNIEYASGPPVARAIALNALGDHRGALDTALPIALSGSEVANEDRREAYVEAGLAALALDDQPTVERLIDFAEGLAPAMRSPLLRAGAARLRGLLAQRRGDLKLADERLAAATRELREIEAPFVEAQVLLEHAELLSAAGREDEAAPRLAEAISIFERLRAGPWLARARALATGVAA
jgi:tetratricopeptide (TPR) repeat protein